MASDTASLTTKISPYHYTLLSQRIKRQAQRIPPSVDDTHMLDHVERTVFDRLAGVLRLSYAGKNITTRYALKVAFESATINGSEGRAGTLSQSHLFNRALSNGAFDVDWQSFADFYALLTPADKETVDNLLLTFTAKDGGQLLDCDDRYWTVPTKTQELQQTRHIVGRDWVCTGSDVWLRADRFVARYQVFVDFADADENGFQSQSYCFGTAATLQGAVEIAMEAPSKVEIIHDAQAARVPGESAIPARLKILETDKAWPEPKRLLNARFSSMHEALANGDSRQHFSLSWIDPVSEADREAVEQLIKMEEQVVSNAFKNGTLSHADLAAEEWDLENIKATLPPEGYTSKQISDALVEALQNLGSDVGIASLLERDLGL